MFKLYKKLRPVDWMLLVVLLGLTVLQVSCTMTMVDYIRNIIQSITFLNYHNNPQLISEEIAALVQSGGWDAVLNILPSFGLSPKSPP